MKSFPAAVPVVFASVLSLLASGARAAEPVEAKKSTWEGSIGAGLTITGGNSKSVSGNLTAQANDKWENNELLLKGSFLYGKTDGLKSSDSLEGDAQYNKLFTERLYGGLKLNIFHDDIAGINYRITVAPLAGYYFIKQPNMTLSGEVGPAYVYLSEFGSDNTGFVSLRVAERFEYKLSGTSKVWQSAEFLPRVEELDDYLFNFEIGAEASLNTKLSLRAVLQDYFVSQPATGRLKNDVRLITSVVYKF